MNLESKIQLVRLLDEYCNEYYCNENECRDCYFYEYKRCPISMTANRLQREIFDEEQSLDKDNGQLDDDNGNNDNLELINRLRSFCEQYDGVSCVVCPIYSKNEAYCPLNLMVKRLSDCL